MVTLHHLYVSSTISFVQHLNTFSSMWWAASGTKVWKKKIFGCIIFKTRSSDHFTQAIFFHERSLASFQLSRRGTEDYKIQEVRFIDVFDYNWEWTISSCLQKNIAAKCDEPILELATLRSNNTYVNNPIEVICDEGFIPQSRSNARITCASPIIMKIQIQLNGQILIRSTVFQRVVIRRQIFNIRII